MGIGVVLLLGIIVASYWFLFSSPSDPAPTAEPSVTPMETGGALPSTSAAPVAFGGVCPDTWVSAEDTDRDSLPDSVEVIYGTDPNNPDTDGDGYTDGEEVRAGYDPASSVSTARLDSDGDGLFDNEECVWGTDPFNPDSDNDGYEDGAEVKNGFDPTKKGDGAGSDRIQAPTPAPLITPYVDPTRPTPVPTAPQAGQTTPPSNGSSRTAAQLTLIPFSQLQITGASTSASVKTYLAQVDSLRPAEFSDGQIVASAIQDAANGNIQPLSQVRGRIARFSDSLKQVAAPQPTQEYHQLYVSLIQFTAQQLLIIEQNAIGANQQLAVQALTNIQTVLPTHVARLSQLRQSLEGFSNQ